MSDGSGGAIITWQDKRSGTNEDIYAQRVHSSGAPQWAADGVAICTASGDQKNTAIVSDGSGGAIIAWEDWRSGPADTYAQRVDSSGTPQWTADGVAICNASGNQWIPAIVSDSSSGAIITWTDYRSGTDCDIYAQRVDSSGTPQWTADGVAICTASGDQYDPTIVSDGSGGAIITWKDYRSGTNYDIYSQRVDSWGAPQWAADGVAVCTASGPQYNPAIVSDGSGGAIITWVDGRSGTNWDIYAQRIDASGAPQWTADGVAICTASDYQEDSPMVSDGSGGAIIAWQDKRSGTDYDIYAQRVNADGLLDEAPIVPAFEADQTEVGVGELVTFTNLTTGGSPPYTTAEWDFDGDGLIDTTLTGTQAQVMDDVSHAYAAPGVYTVGLWMTDSTSTTRYEERPNYITVVQAPVPTHTCTFYAAGFFPKHLPDAYTGQVVLAALNLANIPDEVQGVWWYDPAIMDYRFWVPGVGGDLMTLTGQFYNYKVLVTGACAWEIPLP